MARNDEEKRVDTTTSGRRPRPSSPGTVSAEDIRRLVAKLKGEEVKK